MTEDKILQGIDRLDSEMPFDVICVGNQDMDVHELLTEIKEMLGQREVMKSCLNCAKYHNGCDAWMGVTDPPVHNINDGPCDEWELG